MTIISEPKNDFPGGTGPVIAGPAGVPYPNNKYGISFSPVEYSGAGGVLFTPLSLADAGKKIVFRFSDLEFRLRGGPGTSLSGLKAALAAEEKRLMDALALLNRLVPGGKIATAGITDGKSQPVASTSKGSTPQATQTLSVPHKIDLLKRTFGETVSFDVPQRPAGPSWSANIENLTGYSLNFTLEAWGPSNLEEVARILDLGHINPAVSNFVSAVAIKLDTKTGSISVPGAQPTKLDFKELTDQGITLTDLNSASVDAELMVDPRSPCGLSLKLTVEFESAGHEGTLAYGWTHDVDIDGLAVAITLPLVFSPLRRSADKGSVSFDAASVSIDTSFSSIEVSSAPDSIFPDSFLKKTINNALKTAIGANKNTIDGLLSMMLLVAGLSPSDNQVVGTKIGANGAVTIDLVTRRKA